MQNPYFIFQQQDQSCLLKLTSHWKLGEAPSGDELCAALPKSSTAIKTLSLDTSELKGWDSSLPISLNRLIQHCEQQQILLAMDNAPKGLQQLLKLASGVPAFKSDAAISSPGFLSHVTKLVIQYGDPVKDLLIFIGETAIALANWIAGRAKTRKQDIAFFFMQTGPNALAIVTLIALAVGMILAYLGSVQLRQLGAQVYVGNLVSLGMVREMAALMTAIIMSGRTGAAYAAQLGTMQVNEEIDALKTMGVSSVEFLVVPRVLALVLVMPLLYIYANAVGIFGGGLVAISMDVNITQYILQTQKVVDWIDIFTGLIKSVAFGLLIAVAGCQAGLSCGRNSDAVGMAATKAVVRSIVFIVVADAAFNILFFKMGI